MFEVSTTAREWLKWVIHDGRIDSLSNALMRSIKPLALDCTKALIAVANEGGNI